VAVGAHRLDVHVLTQEVLGAKRLLPIGDAEITNTITELFLRGVAPDGSPGGASA